MPFKMTLDDIWGQLESDLSWRQEELRLLSNSISGRAREADRDRLRRAQIVMLYAHAEGFCKVALSTYIRAINDLRLKGTEVSDFIVALSFSDVFHAIAYGDPKGKVFNDPLPDDAGLHTFGRRRDFIAAMQRLMARPVIVPDDAVDTESNLNSKVLRRNLYRLGFSVQTFAQYDGDLDELVYRRHSIAHGIDLNPIRKDLYEKLERVAFQFMDELVLSIVDSIETSGYLRASVVTASRIGPDSSDRGERSTGPSS
jgi:hypothetical protein